MFPDINNFHFVVIGLGRVGTSLLLALKSNFNSVDGIHTNQIKKFFTKNNFQNLVIFLTVKDDLIEEISNEISQVDFTFKNGVIFHTCGGFDTSVLKSLKKKDFKLGTFHPLYSFKDKNLTPEIWNDLLVGIDGENLAINSGIEIANKIGAKPFILKSGERTIYHTIASLFAESGFTLGDIVEKFLKRFPEEERGKILNSFKKLLFESFENRIEFGVKSGTGPATRKDFKTIENHLKSIKENFPEIEDLYRDITNYVLKNFNP